jgi:hypothetical protein
MHVEVHGGGYDVRIEAVASEDGLVVGSRVWEEHIDR